MTEDIRCCNPFGLLDTEHNTIIRTKCIRSIPKTVRERFPHFTFNDRVCDSCRSRIYKHMKLEIHGLIKNPLEWNLGIRPAGTTPQSVCYKEIVYKDSAAEGLAKVVTSKMYGRYYFLRE